MHLTADTSAQDLETQLAAQLVGLSVDGVTQALAAAGALGVVLTDFGAEELERGILLDDVRTGEPLVVVVFGITGGGLRPPRRARMVLRYSPVRQITEISSLAFAAK